MNDFSPRLDFSGFNRCNRGLLRDSRLTLSALLVRLSGRSVCEILPGIGRREGE